MQYRITEKEEELNAQLRALVQDKPSQLLELLINDVEVRTIQEYANHVSIARLNYNDHGPVHMRIVARNALQIAQLLRQQGFKLSLTKEGVGTQADEDCALLLAGFLHDTGMTLTRQMHEQTALVLTMPIMNRLLDAVYGEDPMKYVVRSLTLEAILGHMGTVTIHSLEAGVMLVADGCDLERGRAELVIASTQHDFDGTAQVGTVHQHSVHAIDRVRLTTGTKRKVAVIIQMRNPTGYFQVEETLLGKMKQSPIKGEVEVVVHSQGLESVVYLL
ncbi:phosphohydrolase [Entomospira culicis]|uniref:Phosphohydrolase n=1 Tax=Entomospira culicis TaxID=2719989 RepID=A0A968KZV1_9SPIO|nr:phosphohydrolase [Entomospira culicis]NIZ19399.1 phosphohydrolase [Entomospira culicis]NIZ69696.1 phosphohydrolase [Entomospira culicis]WDI36806.1 phosphohydrolase [Entomospira culicis]WDI38435.1 phosphohydrolase [Entomospira culicis]